MQNFGTSLRQIRQFLSSEKRRSWADYLRNYYASNSTHTRIYADSLSAIQSSTERKTKRCITWHKLTVKSVRQRR